MLEIALLTAILMAFWYIFLAVKAVFFWMWERVLAVRALSYSLSLECRRRRDLKRAELNSNRNAYDRYHQTRNAAALQEHRRREHGVRLRGAFHNLSGLHGLMSLATEVAEAGDLPVGEKRVLFNEFLPVIAREVEAGLRSGVTPAALRTILSHLANSCGLQGGQVDLMLASASSRAQFDRDAAKRTDFASLVQQELSLHRERLQAIEQLRDDPALEQMLEVEHRRHSQVLVQLSAGERNPNPDVVTL